jgi:hypothetical protein
MGRNRGDGFRVRYRLDDGTIFTENGYTTQDEADNRATDVESDQRRRRFTDPRLARTTIDQWIRTWTDAHHVSDTTWTKYDSPIRNHILPRWTDTALGDIQLAPKTPASVRPVHLPPFLVTLLTHYRQRNPNARFVFTGADGGLHRRSNFRRRVWLPALAGDPDQG